MVNDGATVEQGANVAAKTQSQALSRLGGAGANDALYVSQGIR